MFLQSRPILNKKDNLIHSSKNKCYICRKILFNDKSNQHYDSLYILPFGRCFFSEGVKPKQLNMALKPSKLEKIPQRNKDITFGYVNQCEKDMVHNGIIPRMIKYLCLIYFNQNKDEFDDEKTNAIIIIKENSIELPKMESRSKGIYVNSYLTNIASEGIHVWKFKGTAINWSDRIGIMNIDIGTFKLKGDFDEFGGYAFRMGGVLNDWQECKNGDIAHKTLNLKDYGHECKNGDIIQMTINLKDLTLNYKINNKDCGKAFDINKGRYKAAISFDYNGQSCILELISYQHIV